MPHHIRFATPMGTLTVEGRVFDVCLIQGDRYYVVMDDQRRITLVPAEIVDGRGDAQSVPSGRRPS